MDVSVKVKNLDKLNRELERLAKQSDTTAKQVIVETASDILAQATALAPVATGNLKNSLFMNIEDGGLRAVIGAGADYSAHVEFGTHKMAAQPYMYPSFESNRKKLEQRLISELKGLFR